MRWEYYVPRVQQVIEKRFPETPTAVAQKWANRIYDDANTSGLFDQIRRMNRTPQHDEAALANAAKYVRLAAKKLRGVGWHGSGAIQELVQSIAATVPGRYVIEPHLDGPLFVSTQLEEIAAKLEAALIEMPRDAPPVLDLPISDSARGQPKKTAHLDAALRCAEAYRSLAQAEPTVRTSDHPHKAYGPFLDFVADVLRSLDIEASAEAAARHAVKETNPPKA